MKIRNKFFILTILLILISGCETHKTQEPLAISGILDLTSWDTSQVTGLNGTWEFYWNTYILPGHFNETENIHKKMYASVPDVFNNIITNSRGIGYATYRLQLILPDPSLHYSLYLKRIPAAYSLYFNGKKAHATGIVGTNMTTTLPRYSSSIVTLYNVKTTNELVFHVVNFHGQMGGLWKRFLIGTEDHIRELKVKNVRANGTFVSLLLFMTIYYITLFFVGINKPVSAAFGLLCLIFALRVLVMDELLILNSFPRLPWQIVFKSELITYYFGLSAINLFYYAQYHKIMSRPVHLFVMISGGFLTLLTLFTPPLIYLLFINPWKVVIFLTLFYLLYISIKAIRLKIPGSILSILGLLSFMVTAILDVILFTIQNDRNINLTPYGMLGMVFFESLTIFRQLSEANKNAEILEVELRNTITKEKKLNELKNRFITYASHEFRTPLAVIQLSANTLHRIDETRMSKEKRSDYFTKIDSSISKITNIMDDILVLGKQRSVENFNKPEFSYIDHMSQSLMGDFTTPEHSFQLNIKGTPFPYQLDPILFNHMLSNLLSNAVKYSDAHTVIDVELEYTAENILIRVSNTGMGIPVEEQEFIFDDFFRASNTADIPGTGLGLAIVKTIINKLNGEITFTSLPGKSTSFTLKFQVNEV